MNNVDLIGDIHGHADKLEALLLKLGYKRFKKGFKHAFRKVIFVGDYIDRGPNNLRVIELVRSMVDAGNARALCGNHEHNAICFNIKTNNGYLREHSIKNYHQHSATLKQFLGKQTQYDETIEWFKSLPLFYETPHFRVVHATWEDQAINYLKENTNNGILKEEQYFDLMDKESDLFKAVETTCKGKKQKLPAGKSFLDTDGTKRTKTRIKWWLDPSKTSLKDMSLLENVGLSDAIIERADSTYYDATQIPVFFGHYWFKGLPTLCSKNVCCLDYSIAKNGFLCAYRFGGERQLLGEKLVYV